MSANVRAMAFNTKKFGLSWHRGEVGLPEIETGDTVTAGMQKCGMYGIGLEAAPMFIQVNEKMISAKKKQLVFTNVPWQKDGIQIIGRQIDRYVGITNQQFCEVLDPLTESYQLAGVLQVGTAGQIVIIQMEMDDFEIGGNPDEMHRSFLMVSTDHLTGRHMFGTVITRVVCENTYNAARKEKGTAKSLPCGADGFAILKFRTLIERQAIEGRQDHIAQLNRLFTQKAQPTDIDNLCNILFPMPTEPQLIGLKKLGLNVIESSDGQDAEVNRVDKKGNRAAQLHQNAIDRTIRHRNAIRLEFESFNDRTPYCAGTKYALWQAVTGHQHSPLYESEADTHMINLFTGNLAASQTAAFAYLNK